MGDSAFMPAESHFVSAASLRVRLDWFNRLRWGAVAATLAALVLARGLVSVQVPPVPLLASVAVLAGLNAVYVLRNRRVEPREIRAEIRLVKLQMAFDLVLLTVILNLTGGVENPLLYVYVLHVIIAALLFKGREIFHIAWLAIALFTLEVAGEYFGVLPHHHLLGADGPMHEPPYIALTLASFWFVLLFGAHMGAVIMRHNRAIKDELVRRQQELIEADRARMDFYRFVAHEVKSPIATAQSAVETALELGGGQLPPVVDDLLTRTVGRLEQATAIVRNLADLTRSGLSARRNLKPLNLSALVTAAADEFRELAGRRSQAIVLDLPAIPVVVTSNEAMLGKVVTNLVSNAVRYNRDGGEVRVALEDEGDRVRLTVTDQGIGIDPADHERIFEEFYRSAAAQAKTDQGTGLGLPIVRRFVNDLGGSVDVAGRPGEGAEFTVVLPRRAEVAAEAQGEGSGR